MSKINKRNIPYIIVAIVMIAVAFLGIIIMKAGTKEEETTEEITTQLQYINGDTPYYPSVAVSSLITDCFDVDENGRIIYTDKNVKYSTGIDVSQYQGDIDWQAVADDGIDFAIIRVGARGYGTKGIMFEDSNYQYNIENAIEAGLDVGVYFYSQATSVKEAEEEAEYTLSLIKNYNITAPVVFDWENMPDTAMRTDNVTSETLSDCANAFCKKIENAGYLPSIYFNLSDGYTKFNLDEINGYPFWFAQYEGTFPQFYYSFDIWQYSSTGEVDGIDANVDMNIAFVEFG